MIVLRQWAWIVDDVVVNENISDLVHVAIDNGLGGPDDFTHPLTKDDNMGVMNTAEGYKEFTTYSFALCCTPCSSNI